MLDIKEKNIVIYGLGITGINSIKALNLLGANIFIYDDRRFEDYKDLLVEFEDLKLNIIKDKSELSEKEFYCILKSPGIKPENEFLNFAKNQGVEIISDIELAYRIFGGYNVIAITGTNGKTTTTSLIAHILNSAGIKAKVVGNIGVSILLDMVTEKENSIYVIEMSSFQLDATKEFKPHVSVITNITPDHIDWHGSFENYKNAKLNIFANQDEDDYLIINKDDSELSNLEIKSKVKYFSLKEKSNIYFDGEYIIFEKENKKLLRDEFKLVGDHNVANLMASLLAVESFNIDFEDIIKAINSFKSIEHRIEYVTTIEGVKYYNDSKGTNIDSTKVALKGFKDSVILIAGGYDKGSNFDELFEDSKIKSLLLFGQTKNRIAEAAKKSGIKNVKIFDTLTECVNEAKNISVEGDVVLFSPACASWDMYKNYEERGRHFKKLLGK